MTIISIGDLATSFALRGHQGRLKAETATLVEELTTGRSADLARTVSGDYSGIAGIERALDRLEAHKTATIEAAGMTDTMQTALTAIAGSAAEAGPSLLSAGNGGYVTLAETAGVDALQRFEAMLGALNTRYAGRSVFAGQATDAAPMAPAADIITALETAISGAATAADVETALDTWFAPGGDFDTVAYQGSANTLGPTEIGQNSSLTLPVTAADDRLRDMLKGMAMAALINSPPINGNADEQIAMAHRAGELILSAQGGLTVLQAEIGTLQGVIAETSTANQAETTGLEIARSDLLEVDVFERATRLEEVQTQLETLYAITARASRMSLVDYL